MFSLKIKPAFGIYFLSFPADCYFYLWNTIEYAGDESICIFGHPASKNHTGNWKASSLSLGKYRKNAMV